MDNKRVGFLTTSGILAGILTIVATVVVGWAGGGLLFSPGPLNAKTSAALGGIPSQAGLSAQGLHADFRLITLGGVTSHAGLSENCAACHPAFWDKTTMADLCVVCHTDITAQKQDPTTLHGNLLKNGTGLVCQNCHPDHKGAQASLTDLKQVNVAHDAFSYALTAHAKQSDGTPFPCTDCHGLNYQKFDQAVCTTCHQQIKADFVQAHVQTFGNNCLACHDGIDTYGHNFNHNNAPFQLTGKHAPLACDKCHQNASSLAAMRSTPTDCATCHKKDNLHSDRLGTNCADCHKTTGWTPAKFDHKLSAYPLVSKHAQVACVDCHLNNVYKGTPTDCASCHTKDDKHNGQYGTDCALCHTNSGWKPAKFDHTAFPLNGKHADATCVSCHVNKVFKGTPIFCAGCHEKANPHSSLLGTNCGSCHTASGWLPATFDHNIANFKLSGQHAGVASANCHVNNVYKGTPADCASCHKKDDKHTGQYGTNCALCHSSSGWKPANFDHSRFPLNGKHVSAACTSCHVNGVFQGTVSSCNSCHSSKNPHSSLLGTNCGSCHTANGWLPATFDHNIANFKLSGQHAGVACSNCHVNNVYKGTPTNCATCHKQDDKHNGQYGTNCSMCHSSSAWKPANFDHSKFPLTGKHASAACTSCHANNVFKGTPTNCNSCHSSKNPHSSLLGTNCGNCHTSAGWLPASFDHNMAAFKLTGAHTGVACTSCHANGVYKGTPTNCYGCHKSNDNHNGQLGTACGTCHSTSAWKPATFDHNTSAFKLTGSHAGVSCTSCHANGVYQGTPTDCYSCHKSDDNHNGQFGTACGSCHSNSAWKPATFDHNSSAFKLTGAHAGVSCTSCHTNGVYKGTPTDCYSCHKSNDNHNGAYGTNCASCHSTSSWSGANFSHTGFSLTNGHAGLSCNSCHSSGTYAGLSTACSSCHSAPGTHAGLGSTCTQCHNTGSWTASYSHPSSCDGSCLNHHRATCADCHTATYATFTCTKCHDSNKPGD